MKIKIPQTEFKVHTQNKNEVLEMCSILDDNPIIKSSNNNQSAISYFGSEGNTYQEECVFSFNNGFWWSFTALGNTKTYTLQQFIDKYEVKEETKEEFPRYVKVDNQEEWDEVRNFYKVDYRDYDKDCYLSLEDGKSGLYNSITLVKNTTHEVLPIKQWREENGLNKQKEVEYEGIEVGDTIEFGDWGTARILDIKDSFYYTTHWTIRDSEIKRFHKNSDLARDCKVINRPSKKQVVHTETQEQWDFVTKKLGYSWSTGDWKTNKKESCIELLHQSYSLANYFKNQGYEVISFVEWLDSTDSTKEWHNYIHEIVFGHTSMSSTVGDSLLSNRFRDLPVFIPPNDNLWKVDTRGYNPHQFMCGCDLTNPNIKDVSVNNIYIDGKLTGKHGEPIKEGSEVKLRSKRKPIIFKGIKSMDIVKRKVK